MGHEVSCIEYLPSSFEEDPKLEEYLMKRCTDVPFDALMTFNYFQVISKVCNRFSIPYIAWVWDSPILTLYSPTIHNSCNYIFIFDKVLYERLKLQGVDTVYHMPLAVNHIRLEQQEMTEEESKRYTSDLSFVGRLYTGKMSYDSLPFLPDYDRGYLEGCMQAQTYIHGYNFLEEILTDDIIQTIKSGTQFYLGENFTGDFKKVIADVFLGVKVTQMERIATLNLLSSHFNVDLYTDASSDPVPGVNNRGYIDYYTQMPKVFKNSKINLNITHRTIQSGVPLRVFDIMGAGGFLMTNYQSELTELFVDGEDLVIYYSFDDLVEKVNYYLTHEEERRRIAEHGCLKVREQHNYYLRLNDIFTVVGRGYLRTRNDDVVGETE
jgi:spore maturation protein CgeB